MVRDLLRERPPREAGACRQQIFPEVPVKQAGNYVHQAGQYDDPGGFEVEIPAPAVLVGQHIPVAGVDPWSGRGDRKIEQRGSHYVPGFAPIKAWVRDHNFKSAEQQRKNADCGQPVSDADQRGMPGNIGRF